ncbi:MAG: iron chelate uptake ABC transporter family permease subunit, partial [Bacteroides sp.]
MKRKETTYSIALVVVLMVLMGANLLFGSVRIPVDAVWNILLGNEVAKASWSFIIWESRFPQSVTALLCGAALAGS